MVRQEEHASAGSRVLGRDRSNYPEGPAPHIAADATFIPERGWPSARIGKIAVCPVGCKSAAHPPAQFSVPPTSQGQANRNRSS